MNLEKGSHIHFMGICGTAMASLAGLMKERGFKVTGSDSQAYPPMSTQLEKLGIEIKPGYKAENLQPRPDLVVVGNVIARRYEEAQALLESDIPYTSLPRAMADFVIEDRQSVVISGTHGKTTTTSMMAWIAEVCQKEAGYLIGGIPQNFSLSFKNPKGDYFIIEGDEYDTAFFDKVPKFKHYKPRHVILTGVEFDHADIYEDLEDVLKAFRLLLHSIPQDGTFIYNGEDENILKIFSEVSCDRSLSFGFDKGDFMAVNIRQKKGRTFFDVHGEGLKSLSMEPTTVEIGLMGRYNVANALSAFILSLQMGWPVDRVLEGLKTFKGVKRRQEILGQPGGVTVIEDFAHHPTAVRGTIESVQESYPEGKVFSIFEPRSATSRRSIFQQDYLEAFSQAQCVLLAAPYDQSNIDEKDRLDAEKLVESLKARGVEADLFQKVDQIVNFVEKQARRGDTVLVMSNGGFEGIYSQLLDCLEKGER